MRRTSSTVPAHHHGAGRVPAAPVPARVAAPLPAALTRAAALATLQRQAGNAAACRAVTAVQRDTGTATRVGAAPVDEVAELAQRWYADNPGASAEAAWWAGFREGVVAGLLANGTVWAHLAPILVFLNVAAFAGAPIGTPLLVLAAVLLVAGLWSTISQRLAEFRADRGRSPRGAEWLLVVSASVVDLSGALQIWEGTRATRITQLGTGEHLDDWRAGYRCGLGVTNLLTFGALTGIIRAGIRRLRGGSGPAPTLATTAPRPEPSATPAPEPVPPPSKPAPAPPAPEPTPAPPEPAPVERAGGTGLDGRGEPAASGSPRWGRPIREWQLGQWWFGLYRRDSAAQLVVIKSFGVRQPSFIYRARAWRTPDGGMIVDGAPLLSLQEGVKLEQTGVLPVNLYVLDVLREALPDAPPLRNIRIRAPFSEAGYLRIAQHIKKYGSDLAAATRAVIGYDTLRRWAHNRGLGLVRVEVDISERTRTSAEPAHDLARRPDELTGLGLDEDHPVLVNFDVVIRGNPEPTSPTAAGAPPAQTPPAAGTPSPAEATSPPVTPPPVEATSPAGADAAAAPAPPARPRVRRAPLPAVTGPPIALAPDVSLTLHLRRATATTSECVAKVVAGGREDVVAALYNEETGRLSVLGRPLSGLRPGDRRLPDGRSLLHVVIGHAMRVLRTGSRVTGAAVMVVCDTDAMLAVARSRRNGTPVGQELRGTRMLRVVEGWAAAIGREVNHARITVTEGRLDAPAALGVDAAELRAAGLPETLEHLLTQFDVWAPVRSPRP